MKLIDNAGRAWRFVSMQAMAAAIGLLGAWQWLPDDLKASIPHEWVTYTSIVLLVLGMVGRMVKQEPAPPPPESKP